MQQQIRLFKKFEASEKVVPTWFPEHFDRLFPEDESYHYAPSEIAHKLQRNTTTIYRALNSLRLEGMKAGMNSGSWLIPKPALRKWLLGSANMS